MRPLPNRIIVLAGTFALAFIACGEAPEPAPEAAEAEAAPETVAERPGATIASGVAGGTYHDRYASEIDARVGDWDIAAQETAGSTENLDLLAEAKVELALAQADVFASRIAEEPTVFGPLRIVALLGEECVFVAYRKGSSVDEFEDLAENIGEREAIISLGPENGGMAETWNHLSSVLPEQSNADVDYGDGEAGLEKLAKGEVDAVAWMTDPRNTEHALLRSVRANPDLGLLDVEDERLFVLLAGETNIYIPTTLPVSDGEGESVETVCTPALLLSGPRTPVGLIDALKAAGIGRI